MLALAPLLSLTLLAPAVDAWDGLRCAVVGVGDVDGDEVPDFALAHRARPFGMGGAPTEDWPAVEHEPVVWVLSGKDGKVLRSFRGGEGFGAELIAVGDLDGDGITDLAAGDGRKTSGKGSVALLSVGTGEVLVTLTPAKGVKQFGRSLAGGAQLTGDATPDLVIGAQNAAWIVDGRSWQPVEALRAAQDCTLLRQPAEGFRLPSLALTERPANSGEGSTYFPMNLALLADRDGDGLAELALSGPTQPDCDAEAVGSSESKPKPVTTRLRFSGGTAPLLPLQTEAWCLADGRDLDGDGIADVVTTTVDDHTRAWSVGKRALLWEQSYSSGYMHAEGTSLAFTSDHDGDGVADLVLAANETVFDADTGFVSIVSGATGKTLKTWRVAFEADPMPPGDYVGGLDAAPIGDLDGDGYEELAVQLPVLQEVRVLRGKDLSVLWQRSISDLEQP